MSILSWGKCKIEKTPSVDGAPGASAKWEEIDIPKEDTTKIIPTAGTEQTATQEGGELVDVRQGKNTYQMEFEIFVKKGHEKPFDDDDGVIGGEWALRVTPEDEECEGSQIDRARLRVEDSYSTTDGKMLKYIARALKPKEGKTVKPYIAQPKAKVTST